MITIRIWLTGASIMPEVHKIKSLKLYSGGKLYIVTSQNICLEFDPKDYSAFEMEE